MKKTLIALAAIATLSGCQHSQAADPAPTPAPGPSFIDSYLPAVTGQGTAPGSYVAGTNPLEVMTGGQ